MGFDQLAVLLGATAVVITAVAALTKSIADIISAARKKDGSPAPQVGIPAVVPDDDIDYRAYLDMKKRAEDAERALREYLDARRLAAPEEDTHPT